MEPKSDQRDANYRSNSPLLYDLNLKKYNQIASLKKCVSENKIHDSIYNSVLDDAKSTTFSFKQPFRKSSIEINSAYLQKITIQ